MPGFGVVYWVSEGTVCFQNGISYSVMDVEFKYFSYLQGTKISSNLWKLVAIECSPCKSNRQAREFSGKHQVIPPPFQPAVSLGAVGVCHTVEAEIPAGWMRQYLISNLRCSLEILGW